MRRGNEVRGARLWLRVYVLVGGMVAAMLLLPAVHAQAAPANDNFANAGTLSFTESASGTLTGSTYQAGEPEHNGAVNYGIQDWGTVWYAYTPSASVTAELKVDGTGVFAAKMNIYTGDSLSNLSLVTGGHECPGSSHYQGGDCESFAAQAHVTYRIQVFNHNNGGPDQGFNLMVLQESGVGSISGTVVDETQNALAGVCVKSHISADAVYAQTTTASDGTYTVAAPHGSARVEFSDCNGTTPIFSEWHNNENSFAEADAITVQAGGTTPLGTTQVQRVARLSGTVTADDGGGPIPDVCVDILDTGTGVLKAGAVTTSANGSYSMLLPAGSYKVQYRHCPFAPRAFVSEWYADKPTQSTATPIQLASGQVFSANAGLATAGTISGSFTYVEPDEETVCIEASPAGDAANAGAFTGVLATDTTYTLSGLATGTYRIKLYSCGDATNGPAVWHPLHHSRAFGQLVTVTGGGTTDVPLTFGDPTSIDVHAETPQDVPIAGVCVDAYDAEDSALLLGSGTTDSSGNAQIAGLVAGNYKLKFSDCGNFGFGGPVWYETKQDFASADVVSAPWPTTPQDHPSVSQTLALDLTPPNLPTLDSTNPASGSGENDPKVIGTAEAGSNVQLYTDSSCTTPIGASTPATTFASPGIPVHVADNSTTTFYAKATDTAGNASGCSTDSITYTEYTDVTPPAPPTLESTTPASGSNENNPKVRGTAEPGSSVRLFTNPACTAPIGASAPAAAFATPGIAVQVADDSTTTFYAKATDAAGNASGCSTDSITYAERTPATTAACAAAKAKLAKAIAAKKKAVAALRRAIARDRPRARIAGLRRKAAAKKKAVKRARARVRAACS